ncbi:type II secretion system protein GspL [Undibacterium griseum]|uniref:General secretion pathway protein L n=1 Tax=Undibacterium griseum TaxID=2762295 RepID=A0ABR6YQ63_9BURK|nr:type II secretion system protein GspL [Undibacterium griseum]MBC3886042.1 hypothetical protein [Undibacterium griseum]
MASTLYISLPARMSVQNQPGLLTGALPFALMSAEGHVLQQGRKTFAELRSLSGEVRQVSLLLAASDVSLQQIKVPPMSGMKLKSALPNMLEEQIVSDPAEVVLAAAPVREGKVSVAVTDRRWLDLVAEQVKDWPVKKIAAFPAQLAVQQPAEGQSGVAVLDDAAGCLTLLLRQQEQGVGMLLADADASQVTAMLQLLAPAAEISLYVDAVTLDTWQQKLQALGEAVASQYPLKAISWVVRTAGLNADTPDLLSEINAIHRPAIDWTAWRWPLRLVLAAVLVNVAALNLDWYRLKREARGLSDVLLHTYQNSFPKETTIPDPLEQMRQKVSMAQRQSGQFAPNDFAVMTGQFTQIWERVMAGKSAAVSSVEYRERALHVKVKSPGQIPLDQLRATLEEKSMRLEATPDGVLHISLGGKH